MIGTLIVDQHDNDIPHRSTPGVERAKRVAVDPSKMTIRVLEQESNRLSLDEFREFLISCVLSGASDVTVQTDQQPRAEIHGILYRATERPWSPSEVDMVLTEVYGAANARTEINGRRVLDFSYEVNMPDGTKQRFRVNATGTLSLDGPGVEITLRTLPSLTPSVEDVGVTTERIRVPAVARDGNSIGKPVIEVERSRSLLEESGRRTSSVEEVGLVSMLEALTPRDGLVIYAGATGHGKSTTMAAVTRHHLENKDRRVKIVDIQAPIEFTFRDVTSRLEGSASIIGQSEVGRHIESFAEGVRSALRRKPHIINVGEARDFETIQASLEASLTGHLVYTTTHAGSVVEAMRRLLSVFPAEERDARSFDLASSLRFLMVQHLVPRADKVGRLPVREFLHFTPDVQRTLYSRPTSDWAMLVLEIMRGERCRKAMRQTLRQCVEPMLARGEIHEHDAVRLAGLDADNLEVSH